MREAVGPGVEVMGVVKADAYGHGAVEVSRLLVGEGAALAGGQQRRRGRRAAGGRYSHPHPGDGGCCRPRTSRLVAEYDLTPVVHSLEDLEMLDQHGGRLGRRGCSIT